jgi:hypothetical protein
MRDIEGGYLNVVHHRVLDVRHVEEVVDFLTEGQLLGRMLSNVVSV